MAVLQAMVFDSVYDEFRRRGYVRARDERHSCARARRSSFLQAGHDVHDVDGTGPVHPATQARRATSCTAGQVGYLICNIKVAGPRAYRRYGQHVADGPAGQGPARLSRAETDGVLRPVSVRWPGLSSELRDALGKLVINDPSFEFEPETSDALGFGFRCGFLGLLHMEIVQQRLEQGGSDIDLVQTAPERHLRNHHRDRRGRSRSTRRRRCPTRVEIEEFRQPIVRVNFVLPTEYIGPIMKLCTDRRGDLHSHGVPVTHPGNARDLRPGLGRRDLRHVRQASRAPPAATARWTTRCTGYRADDLVRLDILVKGERIDALSIVCDKPRRGRSWPGRDQEAQEGNPPAHVRGGHCRPPSAARDHRPRDDQRDAPRTSPPNATAATSAENASCGKNKRPARNA